MTCSIIGTADILLKGAPKATEGSSNNKPNELRVQVPDTNKGKTYLRDATKPVGDACCDDGTLKDADEMIWPNSPTKLEAPEKDFRDEYEYEPGSESMSTRDDLLTSKVTSS